MPLILQESSTGSGNVQIMLQLFAAKPACRQKSSPFSAPSHLLQLPFPDQLRQAIGNFKVLPAETMPGFLFIYVYPVQEVHQPVKIMFQHMAHLCLQPVQHILLADQAKLLTKEDFRMLYGLLYVFRFFQWFLKFHDFPCFHKSALPERVF